MSGCRKLVQLSNDFVSTVSSTAQGFVGFAFSGYYDKLRFSRNLERSSQEEDSPLALTSSLSGNNSDDWYLLSDSDWLCIESTHPENNIKIDVSKVYGVSKLNSSLVEDASVTEGKCIAPSTRFTKIWRMKNNGKAHWAHKTQLVWLGGDKLCDESFVDVGVPASGLAVGEEVDIRVDLISPKIPGDYIAYWRLVSPEGERFGQRVKVIVQVEESVNLNVENENVTDSFPSLPIPDSRNSFSEIVPVKIGRKSCAVLKSKKDDDLIIDEWDHLHEGIEFDDKFMNSLLQKKKKGVNKNKLLRKKNNRWKY